jgi:hypothetical protein
MDIQGASSGPERAKKAYDQALIDANRALVRAAREDLSSVAAQRQADLREAREQAARDTTTRGRERRDEIELSAAARAASEPSTAEREARIRALADEHRMASLHTPERLERAAQRLLEG